MKLIKLCIKTEYGSLRSDFELNFRDSYSSFDNNDEFNKFHPFCLAGLNGSGKSNVLEVLANIFYHMESCANVNQPSNFDFNPKFCKPNAFELEYYIKTNNDTFEGLKSMVRVLIIKNDHELPIMTYQNYPFDTEKIPVTVLANKLSKISAASKLYLPDLVIGYSSGENEILSIPFLKTRLLHYDEYREALIEEQKYIQPESNLIYIDYEMSQAVLLANFLFQDKKVLKPIADEIGITDIKRFRMNLNIHKEGGHKIFDQYEDTISCFKNCSTSYFFKDGKIVLDFWINKATKDAFKKNFPKGIFQLFRAFQVLYTLNYRTVSDDIKSDVYQSQGYYTDGKLPNPAPEEQVFFFLDYFISKKDPLGNECILLMKNLSDGEQQFLHTLGICLMLKDKNALLLLDEPETHFNPGWRAKFIKVLNDGINAGGGNNYQKDILITSHSPFIISDCKSRNVIVFRKDILKNKVIPKTAKELGFNTYGASVDLILQEIFQLDHSISNQALNEIKLLLKSKTINPIIQGSKNLGESYEKGFLFERIEKLKQIAKKNTK
jgi:restriction system-associated AAA family ATPase